MLALGGAWALGGCAAGKQSDAGGGSARLAGGRISVRWLGDYFEMPKALHDAGIPVMTTGQSDLMRKGLVPDFKKAGIMLDIGGMRVCLSGDTDLFGDMKMLGERYQPNLGIVCVGDGPFTMGPRDAARACQWMGVSHAIPVHYAHNPLVRGIEAGEEFRRALAQIVPGIQVTVMKPGDTQAIAA